MPRLHREQPPADLGQQATGKAAKAEKLRQEVKDFAKKTSWVPIFGSLAQAASRESDAVMAVLWGRGEQGENLEPDQRLRQGLLNHLKAQGNNYKAAIGLGLLFIPEAAIAKAIGGALKGVKVVKSGSKLAKAATAAEKGVELGVKYRKAKYLAEDVSSVIEGLDEVRQHGLTRKAAAQLGSVGLGRLATRHHDPPLMHAVLKFGEKTTRAISRLPEKDLKNTLGEIPDTAVAPHIHKFAEKVLVAENSPGSYNLPLAV